MISFSLLNFKFTQIFLMGQNGFSKMTELSVNAIKLSVNVTEFLFFQPNFSGFHQIFSNFRNRPPPNFLLGTNFKYWLRLQNLHEEESGREQPIEISIWIRRPKPMTEIKTRGGKQNWFRRHGQAGSKKLWRADENREWKSNADRRAARGQENQGVWENWGLGGDSTAGTESGRRNWTVKQDTRPELSRAEEMGSGKDEKLRAGGGGQQQRQQASSGTIDLGFAQPTKDRDWLRD
jgi:hypothetical protein